MPSVVRRTVLEVAGGKDTTTVRTIAWATMADAKISATEALASLERPTGPAYVTLGAGDLAGFLADGLKQLLPQSANGAQVAIVDDMVRVRAAIPLRELGSGALPGLLNAILNDRNNDRKSSTSVGSRISDRDTVELAGTLEVIHPGLGQFRVRELRIQSVTVPPRLIAPILGALRKNNLASDSTSSDAVSIVMPKSVADVRISRGHITLYKAVPPPSSNK